MHLPCNHDYERRLTAYKGHLLSHPSPSPYNSCAAGLGILEIREGGLNMPLHIFTMHTNEALNLAGKKSRVSIKIVELQTPQVDE